MTTIEQPALSPLDAPVLVAIMLAARRTGDRLLERLAREQLEDRHQLVVRTTGRRRPSPRSKPEPQASGP
jgi:hypothetical protein